jgi:hypothetical protein
MNMHPLLVGSTPNSSIAAEAAYKAAHPPPAIVQPAEMTIDQFRVEARDAMKHFVADGPRFLQVAETFEQRWREVAGTRDLACSDIFGCSLAALRNKLNKLKGIFALGPVLILTEEEDKKNTLAQVAALPYQTKEDLLAISDEDLLGTPTPAQPPPADEPAETPKAKPAPAAVPERQPRARNDNGKPVYAMPAWRELTEAIGRAINRNDAVNHLLRSPEDHKFIHDHLSDAFNRAEGWREKAKHA